MHSCSLLLVEHTAVFLLGSVPGRVAFLSQPCTLGTRPTASGSVVCVHRQPLPGRLHVGIGQVVFREPACVQSRAWNSFPNLQIR